MIGVLNHKLNILINPTYRSNYQNVQLYLRKYIEKLKKALKKAYGKKHKTFSNIQILKTAKNLNIDESILYLVYASFMTKDDYEKLGKINKEFPYYDEVHIDPFLKTFDKTTVTTDYIYYAIKDLLDMKNSYYSTKGIDGFSNIGYGMASGGSGFSGAGVGHSGFSGGGGSFGGGGASGGW